MTKADRIRLAMRRLAEAGERLAAALVEATEALREVARDEERDKR